MAKPQKYTDEDFIEVVKNSTSIAQVLRKLNLVQAGGNYHTTKLRIKNLGLDTSHFLGQGHLKGKSHNWSKKIPLSEILVENSKYGGRVRQRILKEGLLEYKCYECNITKWQEKNISFELEHKNGNRFDNRIENLIFLCPNCHSQTKYFRGRNKKRHIQKTLYHCLECKSLLSQKRKTGLCRSCYFIVQRQQKKIKKTKVYKTKITWPSVDILIKMVKLIGYSATGRQLGVSDNAVRKHLKNEKVSIN